MNPIEAADTIIKLGFCPICKREIKKSEYLSDIFSDNPPLEYFCNLITHYRHTHITSWNKMWGAHGRSYQKAAGFGDYEEEKSIINERAKRQLIRKAWPVFQKIGLTAKMVAGLDKTTNETIKVANKFLNDKANMKEEKEHPINSTVTDETIIPFGAHAGKAMVNVPASYLLWMYENKKLEYADRLGFKKYVEENIEALKKEK